MRTLLIILTALFILSLPVSGQDKKSDPRYDGKSKTTKNDWKGSDEEEKDTLVRRVEFGLNFGAYFANKYSANFYNGTPGNVNNNVDYIMSNPTWYREIQQLLGMSATDLVIVEGYPLDMHYNVAFSGGLFVRVNFTRRHGLFLQANYSQLRAADVITLWVNPDNTYLTYPDIRMEQVIGKEGRVMIDFGYQLSFPLKSKINFFIQAGATMCYTQVIKSIFVVEGTEYNLVQIYGNQGIQPGTNQQTYNINLNAFGFGGYLGVGAGIPLTDMFGIEPGFFAHYYPVNLEGYTDFKPSFGIYLRLLLSFGQAGD